MKISNAMRLARLIASNEPSRLPRVVTGYDPDWDGDGDQPNQPDIDQVGDQATLYCYDVIGGWDQPTTESIVRAVCALKVSTIHLRINSPGGDVMEATAIKTALEQSSAKVIAHVDGLAASAASFLMLAADEIEIAPGGFVMIHNPSTLAWGDANAMRQCADLLDTIRNSIVSQYATRAKPCVADLVAMMDAETWLSAEQAVEQGFVDRIMQKAAKASNVARFDLTAFDNTPQALLNARAEAASGKAVDDQIAEALRVSRAKAEKRLRLYA